MNPPPPTVAGGAGAARRPVNLVPTNTPDVPCGTAPAASPSLLTAGGPGRRLASLRGWPGAQSWGAAGPGTRLRTRGSVTVTVSACELAHMHMCQSRCSTCLLSTGPQRARLLAIFKTSTYASTRNSGSTSRFNWPESESDSESDSESESESDPPLTALRGRATSRGSDKARRSDAG